MNVSVADMNDRFSTVLKNAGYDVHPFALSSTTSPGRFAENDYFGVAFQPFSTWDELVTKVGPAELELATRLSHGSRKVWDIYLLLACQEPVLNSDQSNELVQIQYDTRRMRKLIGTGIGDAVLEVDHLVLPFLELTKVQVIAEARDPLEVLTMKLVGRNHDEGRLRSMVTLFREGAPLDGI